MSLTKVVLNHRQQTATLSLFLSVFESLFEFFAKLPVPNLQRYVFKRHPMPEEVYNGKKIVRRQSAVFCY